MMNLMMMMMMVMMIKEYIHSLLYFQTNQLMMCSQMITACVSLNQLVSKLSVILVIIFARMYTISARSVNKFGISGHTSNGK